MSEKEKYITFLPLFAGLYICASALSIIAPFYPLVAQQRGIDESTIGLIFAGYPFGLFFGSLIVGNFLNQGNQLKILYFGLLLMAIGLFVYSTLVYISEKWIFISLSVILRIEEGLGASMFQTPFYSLITTCYPDLAEKMMGLAESIQALGYFSGPALGSFIFRYVGYSYTFIIYGFITLAIMIAIVLKKNIIPTQESLIDHQDQLTSMTSVINYSDVLKYYYVFAGFLQYVCLGITLNFYSPTISLFLTKQYNVSENNVGYYIAIISIGYLIGTIIATRIKRQKLLCSYLGTLFLGISCIFIGPDKLIPYNGQLDYTSIFLFIFGFFSAMPFVLILPLINRYLNLQYPNNEEQCANLTSGVFNSTLALGEFLGPTLGGALTQKWGFQRASSFLGLIVVVFSFLMLPSFKKKPIKQVLEYKIQN